MLHEVLHLQILPKLVETANARRRAEEKAALLAAMPKKRSNRLQVGWVQRGGLFRLRCDMLGVCVALTDGAGMPERRHVAD